MSEYRLGTKPKGRNPPKIFSLHSKEYIFKVVSVEIFSSISVSDKNDVKHVY